ncbi:hypothetical protein V5799_013903 [Amblyomma americanum]|uniref:Uncharacterized protein n=1 Tax=Amblyomma americanum TaxID=6943 RepID=A0AAQ4E4R9_AMBAM
MKSRSRTTSSHWSSGVSRPTSPSVRAPKAPSAVVVTTPLAPAQVAIQGGWTPSGLAVNVARRHSRSVPSSHESELLVTEGRLSAKTSRSADCRFLGLPSLPESNVSLEVGGGISTLSRKSVEKVSVTSVGSAGGSLLWAKSPFVEIMPIVQSSKSVTLKRSGVALSSSTSKVKATAFESQSRLSTYRAETPSRHRSTKGSLTSISNQRDLATAMADIARRLFDRKSQETGIFAEYERTAKSLYASPATSHSSLLRRSRRSLELTTRPLAHDLQEDIAGSQSALVEIRADSSATKIAGESRRVSGMELRKRSETMMKLSSTSLAKTAVPSGSSDLLAASTKSSEERISRDLIIDAREQEAGGALEATEAVGARQATARQSATSLGGDQKVTAVQEWPSAEQIIDAKERWSITTDRSADAAVAAKASTSDLAVASRRISSAEEGKSSSYMTSPQETSPTSPTKKGKKVRKVLKRGSAPSADDENRSISEQIAQALSEADYGDMPLQVNMTIDLVPPKSASATSTSRGVLSPVHIEKKMIVESCKDGHVEVKVPPVFIDSPDGKHVSSEALNVSVSVDIGKHAKEGHKCDLENEASKATGSEAKP